MEDTNYKNPPADLIFHYFKDLSPQQQTQFNQLKPLYQEWNVKINLISRKDIHQLYPHHVLHSLAIARVIRFKKGTKVVDIGTGGGFPAIPLAILFPEVQFHLVDAIGKKISAVQHIVTALSLTNVTTEVNRGENIVGGYDFVLGRGVTQLVTLYHWVKDKILSNSKNTLKNGILYLRGDDFSSFSLPTTTYPLDNFFQNPFLRPKSWSI